MYIFAYIKLRSYSTKVHQIYTQCSQIVTGEYFEIREVILQSVSERQIYH